MPRTKFQDLIFTIIMVLSMVYCMTLYNLALDKGFSGGSFFAALKAMWPEAAAAFIIQRYLVGPRVRKLVTGSFQPGTDKPIFILMTTAGLTVAFMAPIVTLFATLLHNGFTSQFPVLWLSRLAINFPFALCVQLFYVGPFVRFVFRTVFKKHLETVSAAPCQNP